MRQKILDLLKEVEKIEKVSRTAAGKSSQSANEASGGLTGSYSAAGDAEHARNTANLSIQKAKQIGALLKELEVYVVANTPDTVKPVSYVLLDYRGGVEKSLYFVENPVFVPGYNLVSPISPLGKAIAGKTVGNSFSYTIDGKNYEGKIAKIE